MEGNSEERRSSLFDEYYCLSFTVNRVSREVVGSVAELVDF